MARRDFSGKVILITGAAGGLGAALCHRFAAAGARIAAMDLDGERLNALVTTLPAGTLSIAGNIDDPAACQAAIDQTVAHFGALDGLINNAGISHRSLFLDTDPAVIRRVMEVNFFGAMQMTHAALPHLIETRGAVAAISSVAGYAPLLGRAGYCASKHALLGFFDTLRSEVEDLGVGVTLICPSFIATGIGRAALGGQGGSATSARITAGGESSPDDIAQRIVDALAQGQTLLLPDRTSRLAWWIRKIAPGFYARTMKRRVGAEYLKP
ncbi:SDR family oxidoreductase [Candidatus Skiveiella danica]|uniref:SDR family oxidoreductase n=1 Tax=Candidatus Skiveiella danica TaxID=3386177 RepID=UPI001D308F08|nr:SDR family oxidoreductase [Betaproteobacteria bacterium]